MAAEQAEVEVAAFARAFRALCRTWLWWVLLGNLFVNGIPPVGSLLSLLLLWWLLRLRAATSGATARYLGWCIALAVPTAVMLFVGGQLEIESDRSGTSGWRLLGRLTADLALVLFCRAMQSWPRPRDTRWKVPVPWRRAEAWVWFGFAFSLFRIAISLPLGHPVGATVSVDGWPWPVIVLAVLVFAVSALGPLLAVRLAALNTKAKLARHVESPGGAAPFAAR